jgi:hypothetical protein
MEWLLEFTGGMIYLCVTAALAVMIFGSIPYLISRIPD